MKWPLSQRKIVKYTKRQALNILRRVFKSMLWAQPMISWFCTSINLIGRQFENPCEPLEGDGWPKTTGRLKSVEVDENGLEIIKMLKNGWGAEFFGYLAMIRYWTTRSSSPYHVVHMIHIIRITLYSVIQLYSVLSGKLVIRDTLLAGINKKMIRKNFHIVVSF